MILQNSILAFVVAESDGATSANGASTKAELAGSESFLDTLTSGETKLPGPIGALVFEGEIEEFPIGAVEEMTPLKTTPLVSAMNDQLRAKMGNPRSQLLEQAETVSGEQPPDDGNRTLRNEVLVNEFRGSTPHYEVRPTSSNSAETATPTRSHVVREPAYLPVPSSEGGSSSEFKGSTNVDQTFPTPSAQGTEGGQRDVNPVLGFANSGTEKTASDRSARGLFDQENFRSDRKNTGERSAKADSITVQHEGGKTETRIVPAQTSRSEPDQVETYKLTQNLGWHSRDDIPATTPQTPRDGVQTAPSKEAKPRDLNVQIRRVQMLRQDSVTPIPFDRIGEIANQGLAKRVTPDVSGRSNTTDAFAPMASGTTVADVELDYSTNRFELAKGSNAALDQRTSSTGPNEHLRMAPTSTLSQKFSAKTSSRGANFEQLQGVDKGFAPTERAVSEVFVVTQNNSASIGREGPSSFSNVVQNIQTGPQPVPAATQVAQSIAAADKSSIEVRLSPDELGTVRLVMSPRESGITVAVYAERSETLELLKLDSEELEADLASMGFSDSNLEFMNTRQSDASAETSDENAIIALDSDQLVLATKTGMTQDGLDLRL